MKNRTSLVLCLVPLLLACGAPSSSSSSSSSSTKSSSSSSSESTQSSSQSQSASGESYLFYQVKDGETKDGLEGAPWVNSVKQGVAKKLIQPSLKDDFYLNKTYDTQINAKLEPGDIATGGMPGAIKAVSQRTTKILTEETKSPYSPALRSIYDLYAKEDKTAEVRYLTTRINEIKAISSLDGLVDYLVTKGYDSVWPLFELIRTGDNAFILTENNMGLTPSGINYSYLYEEGEKRQRVIDTTVYLLGLYGYEEAQAKALLDSASKAYRDATVNESTSQDVVTVSAIDEKYPHLRLKSYLTDKLGYGSNDTVTIGRNICGLLKSFCAAWDAEEGPQYKITLNAMKDILILRMAFASVISRGIQGEHGYIELTRGLNPNSFGYNDDMFEKEIFGSNFRDIYDRVYIDNYETKQRRESIVTLMKEVAGEYKTLLSESTWLDASTRSEAVEKLEGMSFDACYPVSLESLPAWEYSAPSSFMEAADLYTAWSRNHAQPVNKNYRLWSGATVTTVNGVYMPLGNSFVIFDGLLASDSSNPETITKEELYGSIGTVIGHEISHAFDVNGSQYDKTGAQRDWWTEKDKKAYQAKVDKIVNVWSKYENKPGMTLSCDEGMLGEIIADMGGVSVCLRLGAKQDNFDFAKYFTSYANMHGFVMSEETLNNLIYGSMTGKQDSHPIPVFRVNGVVNQFQKFYDTFGVGANDKMYVAPENRLNIWG